MLIKRIISSLCAVIALLVSFCANSHAASGPYCAQQVLSKACISFPADGSPQFAPTFNSFNVSCDGFSVNTCRVLNNCLPCSIQFAYIKVFQGGPIGVGVEIMNFKADQLGDQLCYGSPYHRGAAAFPDIVKYSKLPLYFYIYTTPTDAKLISGPVVLNCAAPPVPTPTPTPTATPTTTPVQIKITPIAECQTLNSNGSKTIAFGYQNNSGASVTIPLGPLNNMNPGTPDLPLPTFFFQGRVAGVVRSTYTTTPPRWNLNNVVADGGVVLPSCLPNQRPIAVAIAGAPVCQQNGTVVVNLTATASNDPDGQPAPLTYQWATSCPNSTIANPSAASTTMTIALQNGASQSCSVAVFVNDGAATESATANVPSAQCGNGTCNPDACGVCNGNGTSCVDCKGIPNGTTVVDSCGVCGGDNSSCRCTEITTGIDSIDAKFHEQAKTVNRLAALLKKAAPSDRQAAIFAENIKKDANLKMTSAWTLAWGNYSTKVLICIGVEACAQADKAPNIEDLSDAALRLYNDAKKTHAQIKKKGSIANVANATKLLKLAQKIYNENKTLIASLPRFTSTCK